MLNIDEHNKTMKVVDITIWHSVIQLQTFSCLSYMIFREIMQHLEIIRELLVCDKRWFFNQRVAVEFKKLHIPLFSLYIFSHILLYTTFLFFLSLLSEVFLETDFLPSGRDMTVYISPSHLLWWDLSIVVVVVYLNVKSN